MDCFHDFIQWFKVEIFCSSARFQRFFEMGLGLKRSRVGDSSSASEDESDLEIGESVKTNHYLNRS